MAMFAKLKTALKWIGIGFVVLIIIGVFFGKKADQTASSQPAVAPTVQQPVSAPKPAEKSAVNEMVPALTNSSSNTQTLEQCLIACTQSKEFLDCTASHGSGAEICYKISDQCRDKNCIQSLNSTQSSNPFDNLSKEDATHALGVCLAWHSTVKNDQVDWHSIGSKPNVISGNVNSVIINWVQRNIDDKTNSGTIKEAMDGCKIAGLPY
jgi:hypothetical protein